MDFPECQARSQSTRCPNLIAGKVFGSGKEGELEIAIMVLLLALNTQKATLTYKWAAEDNDRCSCQSPTDGLLQALVHVGSATGFDTQNYHERTEKDHGGNDAEGKVCY